MVNIQLSLFGKMFREPLQATKVRILGECLKKSHKAEFQCGKCLLVIEIQFFSISLAQSVFIPQRCAASGKPPIPSNKLPQVKALICFTPLQGDMRHKEIRIHPNQKPVKLYEWLLTHYAKPGDKILDAIFFIPNNPTRTIERNTVDKMIRAKNIAKSGI